MNQGQEVGYVVSSREFLVRLDGLPTVRVNDIVQSDSGLRGLVNSLSDMEVEVLMLDEGKIVPKQLFKRLDYKLSINVGDFLLGRAINPLGVPIDGKDPLRKTRISQIAELEKTARGIESREFITEQFLTGITLVDTIIPLGKGQRELVLGDAHSGKTSFLLNTIVNQKGTNVVCVYASIGKPAVAIRNFIDTLRSNHALEYTVVIATSSSEIAPLIFLTPKTAFTVAEYFQSKGLDVLLILDDLGAHAKIYREIALLGNKSPGRESYPGDIFYQHAHLLERAGNFLPAYGGGSITALPVIELNLTDFTTLIPTNLMSMTDGHLLFQSSLRAQGQTPPIDISLSVSRVGRQTQDQISNLLATSVKQVLSEAVDLETIARFSSELSAEIQLKVRRKDLILEMLKQESFMAVPKPAQIILLALIFTEFFKDKNRSFVEKYKPTLIEAFLKHPKLIPITKSITSFLTEGQLIAALEQISPVLKELCP